MKVSCVLVCFNQERYILEALHSLACQTYDNIEIVISDDCSDDKTFQIITNYIKKSDNSFQSRCVYVQSNISNLGLTLNFEKAISKCTGEIVCIFAGDDISKATRVERVVQAFQSNKIIAYSSNVQCIDLKSNVLTGFDRKFISGEYCFDDFLSRFDTPAELVFNGCAAAYRAVAITSLSNRPINTEDFTLYISSLLKGKVYLDGDRQVFYRIQNPFQATELNGIIHRLVQLDHLLSVMFTEGGDLKLTRQVYSRRIIKEFLKSLLRLELRKAILFLLCLYL